MGGEFAQAVIDGFEHFGDFNELVRVVIRLAGIAVQQGKHAQAVRLARAVGEGGDGDIARVHSGINGAEVGGGAEAGGVMRVDPDGDVQVLFQGNILQFIVAAIPTALAIFGVVVAVTKGIGFVKKLLGKAS